MQIRSNTNKLKSFTKNEKKSIETHQIQLKDFMTPKFISKYSNFIDVEHLFNESNFKIESEKDIENILSDELNSFIINNTLFDSWEEMKTTAMSIYSKE